MPSPFPQYVTVNMSGDTVIDLRGKRYVSLSLENDSGNNVTVRFSAGRTLIVSATLNSAGISVVLDSGLLCHDDAEIDISSYVKENSYAMLDGLNRNRRPDIRCRLSLSHIRVQAYDQNVKFDMQNLTCLCDDSFSKLILSCSGYTGIIVWLCYIAGNYKSTKQIIDENGCFLGSLADSIHGMKVYRYDCFTLSNGYLFSIVCQNAEMLWKTCFSSDTGEVLSVNSGGYTFEFGFSSLTGTVKVYGK